MNINYGSNKKLRSIITLPEFKNWKDSILEIIKRDNPVIIFEHSDLYFKVPSETRIHISDLFSLQSYEIHLIRSGENEFKYLLAFNNSLKELDKEIPSKL